jgi:hypothetical protein
MYSGIDLRQNASSTTSAQEAQSPYKKRSGRDEPDVEVQSGSVDIDDQPHFMSRSSLSTSSSLGKGEMKARRNAMVSACPMALDRRSHLFIDDNYSNGNEHRANDPNGSRESSAADFGAWCCWFAALILLLRLWRL